MRRGHVLLVTMIIVASLGVMVTVLSAQLSISSEHHHQHDERLQLLWAARSAALAGVHGTRRLETSSGTVTVNESRDAGRAVWTATSTSGAQASVSVRGNVADPESWDERFVAGRQTITP